MANPGGIQADNRSLVPVFPLFAFLRMNKKYFKYINTLFIVFPMTLIMAVVGIARNFGFNEGWLTKALQAWTVMLPVAYIAAFFIIPIARKSAEKVMSVR